MRADGRAGDTGERKHGRAIPFDGVRPRVPDEIGGGACRHCDRAGANLHVRRGDTDDIDQQRHRHDRAAAADEAEREADDAARTDREQRDERAHFEPANARRFQGIRASTWAMPQKPVAPAKSSPAPTKAESAYKPGATSAPRATPTSTSEPAPICT